MWLSFVIGMIHQLTMYLYLIHKTDWRKASYEALKRMKREARGGASVSSFRMASDLSSFSLSTAQISQASFSSLTSDESNGEDDDDLQRCIDARIAHG